MKNRRLAPLLSKQCHYVTLVFLVALSFGPGCQKSKQPNPCEDVLSERTPTQVGLLFVDGKTGENILLSKNIDPATITITPELGDLSSEHGMIENRSGSPMYGALVFHIFDTKKGAFKYKINIPNVGITTLSYMNKEKESDNECNPFHISVTDPVIEDHSFTVSRIDSRLILQVML
ncbi:hypothetical protein DYBT9275_00970 [Dyadobacter sp. CECT 9275]|uniref:Uncharacterized protein n=1 Tax=Dyadobacter helix TaxID=2822344 RepID=A0A916NK25_9BACT|nr:hypothetical protein [Dyadobacter sp. CECT 9275]CAG4992474.1 hypothetical protein DYBT9275_00970 [Dyadobacter sp. CECT 9275]